MTITLPCTFFFFFNDTATTEIYTLSLHDALPIWPSRAWKPSRCSSCAPTTRWTCSPPSSRRCGPRTSPAPPRRPSTAHWPRSSAVEGAARGSGSGADPAHSRGTARAARSRYTAPRPEFPHTSADRASARRWHDVCYLRGHEPRVRRRVPAHASERDGADQSREGWSRRRGGPAALGPSPAGSLAADRRRDPAPRRPAGGRPARPHSSRGARAAGAAAPGARARVDGRQPVARRPAARAQPQHAPQALPRARARVAARGARRGCAEARVALRATRVWAGRLPPQRTAKKFPRGGLGDLVHDLDLTRILVGGESLPAETDQVGRRHGPLPAALEGDERFDGLAAVRVRDSDDRRFPDGRALVQHVLDLSRPDLIA